MTFGGARDGSSGLATACVHHRGNQEAIDGASRFGAHGPHLLAPQRGGPVVGPTASLARARASRGRWPRGGRRRRAAL